MKSLLSLFFAIVLAAFSACDTIEWNEPGMLVPRTVDEDPTLPSIFVNGTQLHSEAFGNPNDPMILVVHGGPGSDYRSLLNLSRFAADSFYVVFYDQRGSGLSKRHKKEVYTTVQLFIDDLGAVITYYRKPGQKVILMGQSWGAMLATAYVNQNPSTIDGVVLMEPGGFTWPDAEAYIKRWKSPEAFDETSNDMLYEDQFVTSDDQNTLDYKEAIRSAGEFAKGNKLGIAGPTPFWRVGAVCSQATAEYAKKHSFDFTTNLQQYTTKVFFAYSELNEAYGRSWAEKVSASYPSVELYEVKGSGHEIPYFGWDSLYPAAKAYLDSVK